MSAATKLKVFWVRVHNTRIARASDEWFPEYGWEATDWQDACDFMGEALEKHPNADVDLSLLHKYQRQVDELPARRTHAPSLGDLRKMDPSYCPKEAKA